MPEYVLSEVLKQGFDRPTPIQSQGWPMALKGKNMVGVSATGSGKTLAFLLPAMIHINAQVSCFVTIFYGGLCWGEKDVFLVFRGLFVIY